MDTELELARVRLNSAQDSLMDAQLTWAHAHRDWLQAVNKSARGENNAVRCGVPPCKACGCYVCAGCGEGETNDRRNWGACHKCGAAAMFKNHICPSCEREASEKGREGVGPHTHASNTKGHEYHTAWCEWWMRGKCTCTPATPTGTHAAQPTQPQALDTTSRK